MSDIRDGYGRLPGEIVGDDLSPAGVIVDSGATARVAAILREGGAEVGSAPSAVPLTMSELAMTDVPIWLPGMYEFQVNAIVIKTVELIAGGPRVDIQVTCTPADIAGRSIRTVAVTTVPTGAADNNQWRSVNGVAVYEFDKGDTPTFSVTMSPVSGSWSYWKGATYLRAAFYAISQIG